MAPDIGFIDNAALSTLEEFKTEVDQDRIDAEDAAAAAAASAAAASTAGAIAGTASGTTAGAAAASPFAAAAAASAADALADSILTAEDRDQTAIDVIAADAARVLAQTAAANAQAAALTCATWAVLNGLTGSTSGVGAEVLDSDAGTHTDPVVGGTVANSGRFTWSTSPAGWKRIGATGLSGKANVVDVAARIGALSGRSGYVSAWHLDDGRLLIGFSRSDGRPIFGNGGDIVGRLDDLELATEIVAADRSGILIGAKTADGFLPWHVDNIQGRFYANGRYVSGELDRIEALASVGNGFSIPDYPDDDLACWGDSTTENASTDGWVYKLSQLLGVQAYNGGIGGQGSRQIAARANGVPVRFAAFTIPADTSSVAVTISAGGYTPCSISGSVNLSVLGIAGTLARDGSGDHTFARAEAGDETEVPAGAPGITVNGALYRRRTLIIGSGRNSFKSGSADYMSPAQIAASIRAIIDYQDARVKRAIVWEILPWSTEPTGNASRIVLDGVNAAIAAACPTEWLPMATWLRTTSPAYIGSVLVNDPFTASGTTPTGQDTTDIANGVTPDTFRDDEGHPNAVGMTAIAYRLKMEEQLRGWF